MGYTTEFEGSFKVEPPLNTDEVAFLAKFAETRRMLRKEGPYFVGDFSSGRVDIPAPGDTSESTAVAFGAPMVTVPRCVLDAGVLNHNAPPEGQPGLWCQWVPTEDGSTLKWDEGEKFYNAEKWIQYLIDHFIGSNPIARQLFPREFAFLQGHIVYGLVLAKGEYSDDIWAIEVENNQAYVHTPQEFSGSTRTAVPSSGIVPPDMLRLSA